MHKLHQELGTWRSVTCDRRWLQCGLHPLGDTRSFLAGQGILQSTGVVHAHLEKEVFHVPVASPYGKNTCDSFMLIFLFCTKRVNSQGLGWRTV